MQPVADALRRASGAGGVPDSASLHAYYQEAVKPPETALQPPTPSAGAMESLFNRPPEDGLPDLSNRVSVHMATIGGAGFEQALDAVRNQDVRLRVTVIRNAAPISAAYQAMLDSCETDYYIQVDEDVELDPDAARRLFNAVEAEPPNVAIHGKNLFDTHAMRPIRAVKIHRRTITKRYPYRDVRGCDRDQRERMASDGFPTHFQSLDETNVAGRHGIVWTPWILYERYLTLWEKRRAGSPTIDWINEAADRLFDHHLQEGTAETFFPLMGVLTAALGEEPTSRPEKDFRRYREGAPGWRNLCRFFEETTATKLRA